MQVCQCSQDNAVLLGWALLDSNRALQHPAHAADELVLRGLQERGTAQHNYRGGEQSVLCPLCFRERGVA